MYLTRAEAAELLRVSERTVDRYIKRGLLTAIQGRPGTQNIVQISERSVTEFLAGRFVPVQPDSESV